MLSQNVISPLPQQGLASVIEKYVFAKDFNRPWLMEEVFLPDSKLEMVVKNNSVIDFPDQTVGCTQIAEVLGWHFSENKANVYTFCLTDRPEISKLFYQCDWFVGMTDRRSRDCLLGVGRYEWTFKVVHELLQVQNLKIVIEEMTPVTSVSQSEVMSWLNRLEYPWCSQEKFCESMPQVDELNRHRAYLEAPSQ